MRIYDVTLNDLKNPVLDSALRISWKTDPKNEDLAQQHYNIEVVDVKTNTPVWNSGLVKSQLSRYVPIDAKLQPLTEYVCKVTVMDKLNNKYKSEPFSFHTGKLDSPWTAKWIAAHYAKNKGEKNQCASYLRKEFEIEIGRAHV